MNQIGMNPLSMNQMAMNQMLMNQMGMNPMQVNPMGINNNINQMNMDNTAMNIKSIVQPYENKIKELEEIIRQKDFEITVLKQKLNNQNSNINNINFMNMNLNQMMPNPNIQIPQMPLQQIENKDNEFNVKVISGNDFYMIKCFKSDKISIIREKCNINEGSLIYNYIILEENLAFKDYEDHGITKFPVIIVKSVIGHNIIFKETSGFKINFPLCEDCPLNAALINFLIIANNPFELFKNLDSEGNTTFLYNANKLNIRDKTPIKKFFMDNKYPIITVNSNFNIFKQNYI